MFFISLQRKKTFGEKNSHNLDPGLFAKKGFLCILHKDNATIFWDQTAFTKIQKKLSLWSFIEASNSGFL